MPGDAPLRRTVRMVRHGGKSFAALMVYAPASDVVKCVPAMLTEAGERHSSAGVQKERRGRCSWFMSERAATMFTRARAAGVQEDQLIQQVRRRAMTAGCGVGDTDVWQSEVSTGWRYEATDRE